MYIIHGEIYRFQVAWFFCKAYYQDGRIEIKVDLGRHGDARYFCPSILTIKEVQKYTAHRLLQWLGDCEAWIKTYIEERE